MDHHIVHKTLHLQSSSIYRYHAIV